MSIPSSPLAESDLITKRLVLRPWSADDIAAVLEHRRMAHWADDFPAEGDAVIAGVIADGPLRPEPHHRIIVERHHGLAVGSISLLWPPSDDSAVELGYGVVPSRRGRGYASEAARAMIGLAMTSPHVVAVCAEVERTNPASARVLLNAGMRRCGEDSTRIRYRTATSGRSV
ncbi:GNAT family N-acetyltransferase [Gordonia liuliyuniae]|uniref:GNAT family N-acetyltransferase n=1 Tax=Gordonia liuliyuniae TaxID=2911517 RepID=A0ABS9IQJ2_9ACTN|nr:GNAT family N-acetyltransferase [Gordonia liuliyuniae]MCF8587809.1 GNAT family N-acetyltransferase [Gordonia liuliyuniae]